MQVYYSNKNFYKSRSSFQLPNDIQTIKINKNDLNDLHRMRKDGGFDKKVQLTLTSRRNVMSIDQLLENSLNVKKTVKLLIYVKHQR